MQAIRKMTICAILLFIPVVGLAQDCILIPDKSLCGVAIQATSEQFLKALGKPDGKIDMGQDRVGFLYGQRLLLIFWHKKLWEVNAWEINPNIDFWSYIQNKRNRDDMRLKFEKWSPWGLTRMQMKKYNVDFPVQDEDQFVENRKSANTDLTIFYSPFYSPASYNGGDLNNWESYKIQFIRIRFNNAVGKP